MPPDLPTSAGTVQTTDVENTGILSSTTAPQAADGSDGPITAIRASVPAHQPTVRAANASEETYAPNRDQERLSATVITIPGSAPILRPIVHAQASPSTAVPPIIRNQSQSTFLNTSSTTPSPSRVTGSSRGAAYRPELQPQLPPTKRRKTGASGKTTRRVESVDKKSLSKTHHSSSTDSLKQKTTEATVHVGISGVPVTKKSNGTVKPRSKKRIEDAATAIVASAVGTAISTESTSVPAKKSGSHRGRKRAATPDDAETVEIAPAVVKMADLCRDTRTGRMSEKGRRLQEWEAMEAARKEKENERELENSGDMTQGRSNGDQISPTPQGVAVSVQQSGLGALAPVMRVVNGRIVEADPTRQIDLRANANLTTVEGEMVNQFSHRVNSGTYMRRRVTRSRWDEESTDRFYDGLRMFGTDFGMISKMFPGRSRREIKLKFTKEEKTESERIKETLLGERIPVDMEAFSRMTNTVYRDPSELERDMAQDRIRLEEEQAKEKEALEEAARQRAEVAQQEAAADRDLSAKGKETVEHASATEGPLKKGREAAKGFSRQRQLAPRTKTTNIRETKSGGVPLVQSTA